MNHTCNMHLNCVQTFINLLVFFNEQFVITRIILDITNISNNKYVFIGIFVISNFMLYEVLSFLIRQSIDNTSNIFIIYFEK